MPLNKETETKPKFIILKSIEDTPLTKLSPFLIQKITSTNISQKNS